MRAMTAGLVVALMLTACDGLGSGGELEIIVPPGENGELPPDLIVSCPTGPSFPVSALADVPRLEDADPGGLAAAVAPFLQSGEGAFWPQTGWRILHLTGDTALLVQREPGQLWFMTVVREDGRWGWSGGSAVSGTCPLKYSTPEGLNTVDWRLDPDTPPPGQDDTDISVILTERECVGGRPIGDRLVGPQVVMTDTTVHIAFAAQRPPGDAFDCQGNPDMRYTVTLPEPLGERQVIEGLGTGLSLEDYLD
jgi:hypothetical protein